MDVWRCLVQHLAGRRRLDVHSINFEPVRDILGQISRSDQAYILPNPDVPLQGKALDSGNLAAELLHLPAPPRGVEGQQGKKEKSIRNF